MAGAEGLPGEAVDGKPVDHAFTHPVAPKPSPGVAFVAIGAGQFELAALLVEEGFSSSQCLRGLRRDLVAERAPSGREA